MKDRVFCVTAAFFVAAGGFLHSATASADIVVVKRVHVMSGFTGFEADQQVGCLDFCFATS